MSLEHVDRTSVDDLEVTLAKASVVRIDYLIPIVNLSRHVYRKFAEYIKSLFCVCAALN